MQFDFNKDYILEDDRVLLRPLQDDDIDHLSHFAIKEPDLWKFSVANVTGVQGLKGYINDAIAARQKATEYAFIVYDKKAQAYAGSTRFYDIQIKYNTLQLGYTWYGAKFQRSGLNRHCKLLLLTFAFETLDVERVEFRADNDNLRSIAAMKAIGCTVEGVLRSHMPRPDGKRRNSIVLSILKSEWFGGVKERLINLVSKDTNHA